MEKRSGRGSRFFLLALTTLGAGVCAAGAQTSVNGQVLPPGSQTHTATGNCPGVDSNGMPLSPNDTSCGAYAPGFATPSTNVPPGSAPQQVIAVVRVEAVVEKPARLPMPMEFTPVGEATMVKARMPRLHACFAAGQILSNRSGASTSTTCLDQKGGVIAYQECKAKTGDGPMQCKTVTPGDTSEGAVAKVKP